MNENMVKILLDVKKACGPYDVPVWNIKAFGGFTRSFYFPSVTANDIDESASRSEEQYTETKLEHHTEWQQSYHACGSFRAILLLYPLPVVQDVQKMKDSSSYLILSTPRKNTWWKCWKAVEISFSCRHSCVFFSFAVIYSAYFEHIHRSKSKIMSHNRRLRDL